MASKAYELLNKRIPRNYILKNPFWGTLILLGFFFLFSILYKPFHFHETRSLSFIVTFAFYNLILFVPVFGSLILLKKLPYFSKDDDWKLNKEILSIIVMLFCSGVTLYFAGFIMEGPTNRWNFSTFWGSLKYASLIVAIPFSFFTISNYRYFFAQDIFQYYNQTNNQSSLIEPGNVVQISSQLKNENLSFYPNQLIYCEADGNYVVFHLIINGQYIKKMIRNSINNIEQQLVRIPYIIRIHRTFIVNLKMVASKKGNTLGYQLKFDNIDTEIPVSRNHTKNFDMRMKQLR